MEIYSQKLELLKKGGYTLLYPDNLNRLPERESWKLAESWTETLNKVGGKNTFHPEPDVIFDLMKHSHATILVNKIGSFISGAKIQPWVIEYSTNNIFELNSVSLLDQNTYGFLASEIGGIVTVPELWGNGCGAVVTEAMAESSLNLYNGLQLSVVRPDNIRSANIFVKLGWLELDQLSQSQMLDFDILGDEWREALVFCNPISINHGK